MDGCLKIHQNFSCDHDGCCCADPMCCEATCNCDGCSISADGGEKIEVDDLMMGFCDIGMGANGSALARLNGITANDGILEAILSKAISDYLAEFPESLSI